MALFGTQRDISLFRHLNRELLWDIITQQCVFYQLKGDETKVNIYGEASGAKYYYDTLERDKLYTELILARREWTLTKTLPDI